MLRKQTVLIFWYPDLNANIFISRCIFRLRHPSLNKTNEAPALISLIVNFLF